MNETMTHPKDELAIKLLHYFITEHNYQPIVLHGGNPGEIWLENLNAPYKIVRIMSGYIHNKEQLEFDIYKTQDIIEKIRKKTFSYKMNALSIMIDLNEGVEIPEINSVDYIPIKEEGDLFEYQTIKDFFPNMLEKLKFKEDGMELFVKITNDINQKNKAQSDEVASIFKKETPYVTYALIIINIIIFLLMYLFGNGSEDNATLIQFGALVSELVAQSEFYRLVTSLFLHVGLIHLSFNMYALYILGPQIENFFGKGKFLIIYFLSGIIGNLLSILFMDNTISAGASGAIFGLLGSIVYFGYHHRVFFGNVLRTQIFPIILLNLMIGFTISGINQLAHIGGLIGGYLAALAVGLPRKTSKIEQTNGIIVSILLILFLIYAFFTK